MRGDGLCLKSHTWLDVFVSLLSPHNDFPGFGCRSDVVHCMLIDTLVVTVVDDIAVCYDGLFDVWYSRL